MKAKPNHDPDGVRQQTNEAEISGDIVSEQLK
jgi:hypothetical protein